jgi:hypothetical protein
VKHEREFFFFRWSKASSAWWQSRCLWCFDAVDQHSKVKDFHFRRLLLDSFSVHWNLSKKKHFLRCPRSFAYLERQTPPKPTVPRYTHVTMSNRAAAIIISIASSNGYQFPLKLVPPKGVIVYCNVYNSIIMSIWIIIADTGDDKENMSLVRFGAIKKRSSSWLQRLKDDV